MGSGKKINEKIGESSLEEKKEGFALKKGKNWKIELL